MPHKSHPTCPHDTKAACDKARHEAMGRCTEMTLAKEPTQCGKWAQSMVDGRGICDMHAETILNRVLAAEREARRKAAMDAAVATFMRWTADHPSVWEAMPR